MANDTSFDIVVKQADKKKIYFVRLPANLCCLYNLDCSCGSKALPSETRQAKR
jgi:hypothetical protein